jgi:Fe2+ or Zn2+ uptake regulation protein
MKKILSEITEIFHQLGFEMSAKRRAVCMAFLPLDQAIDAESLWLQMKAAGMAVSRAQVYQTLRLLVNCGFAERGKPEESRQYFFSPIISTDGTGRHIPYLTRVS